MVLRITPWRDLEEWTFVKECLYSNGPTAEQDRVRGLGRVEAWTVRGRVPHAVLSTTMLTSVLIRDQACVMTMLEARMLLAMALTRFVNGLLDPAQQAVYAISMSNLARDMNLPEAFVDIRHSATHDTLPSLPVLRGALRRALDWLWHNYWVVQGQAHSTQRNMADKNPEMVNKMAGILKKWRKLRKEQPERPLKTGDSDPITKESFALLKELQSINTNAANTSMLSQALLSPKVLFSTSSNSADLWQPLLNRVFQQYPDLRQRLVLDSIEILGRHSGIEVTHHKVGQDETFSRISNRLEAEQCTRLQHWSAWILAHEAASAENKKEITMALSLQNDPYTKAIMQGLKDKKGFEAIERMIKVRSGIDTISGDDAAQVDPAPDPPSLQSANDQAQWTLAKDIHHRAIGFLVK